MVRMFFRALPLSAGIVLTLISFVLFIDRGVDVERQEFWGFVFFAMLGIPIIFAGLNLLCSSDSSH